MQARLGHLVPIGHAAGVLSAIIIAATNDVSAAPHASQAGTSSAAASDAVEHCSVRSTVSSAKRPDASHTVVLLKTATSRDRPLQSRIHALERLRFAWPANVSADDRYKVSEIGASGTGDDCLVRAALGVLTNVYQGPQQGDVGRIGTALESAVAAGRYGRVLLYAQTFANAGPAWSEMGSSVRCTIEAMSGSRSRLKPEIVGALTRAYLSVLPNQGIPYVIRRVISVDPYADLKTSRSDTGQPCEFSLRQPRQDLDAFSDGIRRDGAIAL